MFTVSNGSATSWNEDFNDLSNWKVRGFTWGNEGIFHKSSAYNMTVDNGKAIVPTLDSLPGSISVISRESDVSIGEWVLNLKLPQSSFDVYFGYAFMVSPILENGIDSLDGLTESEFISNIGGYSLIITGGILADAWDSSNATIILIKYLETSQVISSYNNFTNNKLPENFNLKINRDSDSNIEVYVNTEKIIAVKDTSFTNSKESFLGSWKQGFQIDNIKATDSQATTPGFDTLLSLSSILLLIAIIRKRKSTNR